MSEKETVSFEAKVNLNFNKVDRLLNADFFRKIITKVIELTNEICGYRNSSYDPVYYQDLATRI